mmetsp:Transcript_58137/g.109552  ORF Transcript_58137/g.109552 Transcript_58137/m.109552 type:complete len:691 (+) Transcript_58137:54-2126(+)
MVPGLSHVATALAACFSTWLVVRPEISQETLDMLIAEQIEEELAIKNVSKKIYDRTAARHAKCEYRVRKIKEFLRFPILQRGFKAYIVGCQTYLELNICGALRNFGLILVFLLWQLIQVLCHVTIIIRLLHLFLKLRRQPVGLEGHIGYDALVAASSMKHEDADGKPIERLPFSPLRCIMQTRLAANSERCKPYAMLELKIVQARGLLAKDFNGKSDPYVFLEFNGKRLPLKTKVRKATLAPKWDETFNLEVFQPRSVCRLRLYDEDRLKYHFGYDGDALGFVDLSIGVLPINKKVIGWVPVNPPSHDDDEAGEIYLELCLKVEHREHEFFALLLGPPCHEFPPLDLPRVKRVWDRINNRMLPPVIALGKNLGALWISGGSLPWFLIVVLLWHANFVIPLLGVILGVLLAVLVHLDQRGHGIIPKLQIDDEEKEAESKLVMLQELLPDKITQVLTKVQYWFDKVIFIIKKFRKIVVHSHLVGAIIVVLLLALAFVLNFVIAEFQLAILQSILSVVLFYFGLLPQTVFFRYIYAFRQSWFGTRLELKEVNELTEHGGTLKRLYSQIGMNTGSELVLHHRAIQKLTESLAQETQPGNYFGLNSHHFEPIWSSPMAGRCEDCARRLWWRATRYECIKCKKVVCRYCAHINKNQLGCPVSGDSPDSSLVQNGQAQSAPVLGKPGSSSLQRKKTL